MAPATVPRKNGVSRDERANVAPNSRCRSTRVLTLRNANAEPRAMMPSDTKVSGMESVEAIAANTKGKPVHISTMTKIS